MASGHNRKVTLYLPDDLIGEVLHESLRVQRPVSWVLQLAWRIAREQLRAVPSTDQVIAAAKEPGP